MPERVPDPEMLPLVAVRERILPDDEPAEILPLLLIEAAFMVSFPPAEIVPLLLTEPVPLLIERLPVAEIVPLLLSGALLMIRLPVSDTVPLLLWSSPPALTIALGAVNVIVPPLFATKLPVDIVLAACKVIDPLIAPLATSELNPLTLMLPV